MTKQSVLSSTLLAIVLVSVDAASVAQSRYTTKGQNIIDTRTGEPTLLQGFGIGVWLLPEGYMWGIRTLDRPRQFEAAIEDLIDTEDAAEFWGLYHDNFFTEEDLAALKAMGANSLRIALLASKLQPREGQPRQPPFLYSDLGFSYLDSVMTWAGRHDIGIIWDMHGAPGAQNAENIADSDGEARLWTEREIYWPRLIDLWLTIARRYAGDPNVIGYDLLNEPLLRRYEGIDPSLLRELYVMLTDTIRTVDPHGLIFIEGDDWAQEFSMLEPIDWDPHLVLAFHTYPPTKDQRGLERWDRLRQKYDVPLWHGETGEQSPPYHHNRDATSFLNSANVGWSWWTHKKLERWTQPWLCPKTDGFQRILDYWMGRAERPTSEEAKAWLFEMAERTNTQYCIFLPEMVSSLESLSPEPYLSMREPEAPSIFEHPADLAVQAGHRARISVRALGFPLEYQWYRNGEPIDGATGPYLDWLALEEDSVGETYHVLVSNQLGKETSREATLFIRPYSGPEIRRTVTAPIIDGEKDEVWADGTHLPMTNVVVQRSELPTESDLSGHARLLWDDRALYALVEVTDDVEVAESARSYNSDGVEFYIDVHGDKSVNYGPGDHQIRINRGFSEVVSEQGYPTSGIQAAQVETQSGYRIEVAFPFEVLSDRPRTNRYIGFDVHVNDSDHEGRETKITWFGMRDNAYSSPGRFGTILLVDN